MLRLHSERAGAALLAGDLLKHRVDHLVCDVIDVGPTTRSADRVYEAHLLKATAVCEANRHLPPIIDGLADSEGLRCQMQSDIVLEGVNVELLAIEVDGATTMRGRCDIISSALHECHDVLLQHGHAETREVGLEGHLREIRACLAGLDVRTPADGHVCLPDLPVRLATPRIQGFNDKVRGEDVRELRPVAVPPSSDLALAVVIVVTRQEMTEDKLWNIAPMLPMKLNGQPCAIIQHGDSPTGSININTYGILLRGSHHVISCID
mmetsp:Transcript_20434/g.44568  ORF Transcript_20434/g.44568 Transcript_20434/m.44568 type:complete len:265 (+) Transcript_20434:3500-4294(+)